jgi:hypothetical protein
MTRNQKIALGCGGAGCLGLIVIAVVGAVAYTFLYQRRPAYANFNVNTNRADNSNSSVNSEDDSTTPADTSSDETSSSSMSDDDKHKLFQAASMTQDTEVIQRVWRKLGFMRATGSMTNEYEQFARDHVGWTFKNLDFIQSINTPEKARAYVDAHIGD